ncbi:src kinase-associated phosphoprotein 2-like [Mya arenaria]|uniref:src kinase-associated phosphoprotein 2-like n=1 Tax=Mya arenaria TaxID=6604 RepID=UPI0022E699DC|nr:src kinase-associated phosphoprotein 2-like [Mya arenaria]
MTTFHENVKNILADVEKFLNETLKKEKLGKKSQEHRQQILERLTYLYEEHPQLAPTKGQDSLSVADESSMTGGSNKSDESEDTANYIDAGVSLIAASDIKDPLFAGLLDKKQRKGAGLLGPKLQQRFCVIHKGVFYYYEKQKDKKQCGSFKLEGYKFRNAPDITTKKNQKELCFEIYSDDDTKRVYQFIAKNKEDFDSVEQFVGSGGYELIEEDIYEEVGADQPLPRTPVQSLPPPPPPSVTMTGPVAGPEEDYVEDVAIMPPPPPLTEESERGPEPPRPPPLSTLRAPPPMPPSVPPPPSPKSPHKVPNTPVEPIQDEIYDEAISKTEEAPPVIPGRQDGKVRHIRNMPLPPPPTVKTKINVNIICDPREDFENIYFGKWDCSSETGSELSFKKGDMIYIISRQFDEKSWWIGEHNGKYGLVPKTFLAPAYTPVEQ